MGPGSAGHRALHRRTAGPGAHEEEEGDMRRTGLMLALLVTVAGGAEAACFRQGHSCNLRPGAQRCCAPLTCQARRCLPPTTSTTTQAPTTTTTSTTTSTTRI